MKKIYHKKLFQQEREIFNALFEYQPSNKEVFRMFRTQEYEG